MLYKTRKKVIVDGQIITAHNANGVGGIQLRSNGFSGLRIDINVGAITGTSITYTVQGYHAAADTWVTLLASAAISSAGNDDLCIDPRATAAANKVASKILPEICRVLSSGTITSVTHTLTATWVP